MSKLTARKQNVKYNSIAYNSTAPRSRVYHVGIDVHKNQYNFAVWNGELIEMDWTSPADNAAVINSLKPMKPFIKGIVYEAGPTGFGLARALKNEGYPIFVAAPSLIPREPSKTNKTDRLDARKLARYLGTKAIYKFVTIPEEKEEDERRLIRTLTQFKSEMTAFKCRIKSFLLSEGAKYGKSWSKNARKKMLDSVKGEESKYCIGKLMDALEFVERTISGVKKRIQETVKQDKELLKRVEILDSHPGVGPQTAAAFALEMFPGRKFENGNQVGSFLGLAPQVQSSGETEIRGSIIKKGRPELRRLLVQCAWMWVRRDKAGKKKFESLCERIGNARKAIVAMARRLGIHLWKMLETGTYYNAKKYANAIKAN